MTDPGTRLREIETLADSVRKHFNIYGEGIQWYYPGPWMDVIEKELIPLVRDLQGDLQASHAVADLLRTDLQAARAVAKSFVESDKKKW